ncbi:MAG: redoxin domain-containing protein [Solirubrobacteraceae bacterium]
MPRAGLGRSACLLLAGIGAALAITLSGCGAAASGSRPAATANSSVRDPGVPISGQARDFTLTDQFGRHVSLRSFRGKVVILAFNDPVCTTICPLTTTAMLQAKQLLGSAADKVELLGVSANPTATQVKWVRAYSQAHQMMHAWHFLTGSLPELKQVWRAYGIEARVVHGQIDHTPAVFVIGPDGKLSRLYMTLMEYTSVGGQAEMLAQSAASLLPGHPHVRSLGSAGQIPPAIGPGTAVTLPRAGGGSLRLGPGEAPHLVLFFDTWLSEVTHLGTQMEALNQYQSLATRSGLPKLIAVDEASVEPSSSALPRFLRSLSHPLTYPVALDRTGEVADGYRVQDEPWLELVSATGKFLWYADLSTVGWLRLDSLVKHVRYALARGSAAQSASGAGTTGALAALDSQAGQLLGSGSALTARLQALRGHPVVLNAWASWCQPCQAEFPFFASASKRWGRNIAFLGADTNDSAGNARTFLQQHPVGYPSYQTSTSGLSSLASIEGLPTTIFIGPAGKVLAVHTGQYGSQAALDHDISTYALRR